MSLRRAIGVALLALAPIGRAFAQDVSLDERVALHMQQVRADHSNARNTLANGFDIYGSAGVIGLSLGGYLYGHAENRNQLAYVASKAGVGILLGAVTTGVIKIVAGRSRPYVSHDSTPGDWKLGAGLGRNDRQSFPSGHTMAAFAFAAAVTDQVNQRNARFTLLTGTLLYGGAVGTGWARMYHDQHWLTDVIGGAVIGTAAGLFLSRGTH